MSAVAENYRTPVPCFSNFLFEMKELEDLAFFPPALRRFQTDFIGYVVTRFRVYDPLIDHLRQQPRLVSTMTDLCSGSGQPAKEIFRRSGRFSQLFLSDKYPIPQHEEDKIRYLEGSRDVLAMSFARDTYYTMFNAFHHFNASEKLQIVDGIRQSGSSALFAEILEPRPGCLLKVLLATTAGSLLLAPFVTPFTFRRLFFTYLLPVNPFTIMYDGIISVLKSRSYKQYRKLFEGREGVTVFRLGNVWKPIIIISIDPI